MAGMVTGVTVPAIFDSYRLLGVWRSNRPAAFITEMVQKCNPPATLRSGMWAQYETIKCVSQHFVQAAEAVIGHVNFTHDEEHNAYPTPRIQQRWNGRPGE